MTQPPLPLPNPGDWIDAFTAAMLLCCDQSTVRRMPDEILPAYRLGTGRARFYWHPQVRELAAARRMVRGLPRV
jgi:hypothetical protein